MLKTCENICWTYTIQWLLSKILLLKRSTICISQSCFVLWEIVCSFIPVLEKRKFHFFHLKTTVVNKSIHNNYLSCWSNLSICLKKLYFSKTQKSPLRSSVVNPLLAQSLALFQKYFSIYPTWLKISQILSLRDLTFIYKKWLLASPLTTPYF